MAKILITYVQPILDNNIVLDKKTGGSIDVNKVDGDGNAYSYRAFRDPVAVQIATLPLTNINDDFNRKGLGLVRPIFDPATGDIDPIKNTPTEAQFGKAFAWCDGAGATPTPKVEFTDDIYFIYSYTDEIVPSSKEAKKNP